MRRARSDHKEQLTRDENVARVETAEAVIDEARLAHLPVGLDERLREKELGLTNRRSRASWADLSRRPSRRSRAIYTSCTDLVSAASSASSPERRDPMHTLALERDRHADKIERI